MDIRTVLKDPVCGMPVTEKSFHHLEQDGQRYYFCGARCKACFVAPARPLWSRVLRQLSGLAHKDSPHLGSH